MRLTRRVIGLGWLELGTSLVGWCWLGLLVLVQRSHRQWWAAWLVGVIRRWHALVGLLPARNLWIGCWRLILIAVHGQRCDPMAGALMIQSMALATSHLVHMAFLGCLIGSQGCSRGQDLMVWLIWRGESGWLAGLVKGGW